MQWTMWRMQSKLEFVQELCNSWVLRTKSTYRQGKFDFLQKKTCHFRSGKSCGTRISVASSHKLLIEVRHLSLFNYYYIKLRRQNLQEALNQSLRIKDTCASDCLSGTDSVLMVSVQEQGGVLNRKVHRKSCWWFWTPNSGGSWFEPGDVLHSLNDGKRGRSFVSAPRV